MIQQRSSTSASFAAALIMAATVLQATAGAGAADLLTFDPASSEVVWTLGSTFHDVHGTFAMTRGEIRFDAATGEASGRIEISATSGESGNESRDRKMHEEVLESGRFPVIVLLPERMTGSFDPESGGSVNIDGTIEIHGVRRQITVAGEVTVAEGHLTGTAHLTIPYVEWGMKDPSAFIFRADKVVEITLNLDGTLHPATAVAPAAE
jgi:polyisoprenoid-binding protein YceI